MTAEKLRLVKSRKRKHSRSSGVSFSGSRLWGASCQTFLCGAVVSAVASQGEARNLDNVPLDDCSQLVGVEKIVDGTHLGGFAAGATTGHGRRCRWSAGRREEGMPK